MPTPRAILVAHGHAHWLGRGQREYVELVLGARYLGEEIMLMIPDATEAVLDQDLAPGFLELANAQDVAAEAGNVVDVHHGVVTALPGLEQDRAALGDLDHRAIAETDSADDAGVELGEDGGVTRHMVGCARVEVLGGVDTCLVGVERRLHLLFVEEDLVPAVDSFGHRPGDGHE